MSQEDVVHGGAVDCRGPRRVALCDLGRDAPFLSTGRMAVFHALCLISHAAGARHEAGAPASGVLGRKDVKGTDTFQNKSPEFELPAATEGDSEKQHQHNR